MPVPVSLTLNSTKLEPSKVFVRAASILMKPLNVSLELFKTRFNKIFIILLQWELALHSWSSSSHSRPSLLLCFITGLPTTSGLHRTVLKHCTKRT
ncbi:unnamed protein product [Moneuplotes crassus]|uniref:Uncharacterized protein n=1 Tax=Euplotes crassus TaxID=5936 RepID=A0AAD2D7V1_EUPCR|nr:unnamed protein product [Moneuplotes crassus]